MTTETDTIKPIIVDIKATLDLNPCSWDDLPALPESLGTPQVQWGFEDQGKIETDVILIIDKEDQIVSFWSTDQDGICNTAEHTLDYKDRGVWRDLEPEQFEAAIAWGKAVHLRICDAVQSLTEAAGPYRSDAYNAVVAFATNTELPVDERTPKEVALLRAGEALKVTQGLTGSAQSDLQVLMVNLRHFAAEAGLDMDLALQTARSIFELERNDPGFAAGI